MSIFLQDLTYAGNRNNHGIQSPYDKRNVIDLAVAVIIGGAFGKCLSRHTQGPTD